MMIMELMAKEMGMKSSIDKFLEWCEKEYQSDFLKSNCLWWLKAHRLSLEDKCSNKLISTDMGIDPLPVVINKDIKNKDTGPCGNCDYIHCTMCAADRCTIRKSRYIIFPDVPNSFIDALESWMGNQQYAEQYHRDEMYRNKKNLDWGTLKGLISTYRNREKVNGNT